MSEPAIAARWRSVAAEGRAGLVTYFTAGYPTADRSRDAMRRAVDAGADFLEVGIPFSDPLADGPTIQQAVHTALAGGMTAAGALALVREAGVGVPVILMTYLNPVLAYGVARFAADAREAGVHGVVLTDLPAGVDAAVEASFTAQGVDVIRLVAPTTPPARMATAVRDARGFVYLISRLGVTGARDDVPPDLAGHVARIRNATPLPVAVGFGIGTPEQAAAAARAADGVVVGSALVAVLGRDGGGAVAALVSRLAAAVRGART